jgi:peptidyl-prolyl cis-trans isomerase SurA
LKTCNYRGYSPHALAAQEPTPPPTQKPTLEKPDEAPAAPAAAVPAKPAPAKRAATSSEGKVIEEIVARVNNEVITRSELEHSKVTAEEDAKQDCQNRCTPEQLKQITEDSHKNALRSLIDQSLLVQRQDMSISVEPDVIKQLDQIRIENKLESLRLSKRRLKPRD